MSVLGLYANQGLITGRGPEDTKERAVLRETGWQEYSIKVGDQYISYQRFEPFGILPWFDSRLCKRCKHGK